MAALNYSLQQRQQPDDSAAACRSSKPVKVCGSGGRPQTGASKKLPTNPTKLNNLVNQFVHAARPLAAVAVLCCYCLLVADVESAVSARQARAQLMPVTYAMLMQPWTGQARMEQRWMYPVMQTEEYTLPPPPPPPPPPLPLPPAQARMAGSVARAAWQPLPRASSAVEGPHDMFAGLTPDERQALLLAVARRPPTSTTGARQMQQPQQQRQHDQELPAEVVPPNEYFSFDNITEQELESASYVIDHKRYVEQDTTRCFASTILDDPSAVEPSFIVVRPGSEVRLEATAAPGRIRAAGFDPRLLTTIVVHGFTQSYPNTTWLRRTRALFEQNSLVSRQNLIIMDWGKAAHGSYAQVAAMVSGMGSFLANFITKLIRDLGAERMSIRIVGHSLGAHVAGFAGKRIRPRIGRITALDPAGPCFGKFFSNSPVDRLSPDDAYEVDVFHYDDDFLGLPGQHGQFDVYVNGGSKQPGCKDNMNAMFQAVITMLFRRNRVLSESHTRSTEVATAQLAPTGCQEVAYECRDWAAFTQGECGKCDDLNNQCFLVGFDFQYAGLEPQPLRTSFPGKRLYLATGNSELFCTNHYQILVRFEPSPEMANAAKRNKWRLQLELVNDQRDRLNITMTNQMAPHVFSYLLLAEASRPMRVEAALVQLRASDGSVVALQRPLATGKQTGGWPPRVLGIDVNFMSNISPLIRRTMSSRLCPVVAPAGAPWLDDGATDEDSNSIADSSPDQTGGHWAPFEECLRPA